MHLLNINVVGNNNANTDKHRPPTSVSVHSASPAALQHVAPKKTPVISTPTPPAFPADYFLDNFSFQCRQGQIPLQIVTISTTLLDFTQEPRLIARLYFERVHSFFPFISNKNFYGHFPPAYAPPNPISTILIACMKLVSWSPKDDPTKDPKSPSYFAIKRTLVETDIAGVWSLQLLQATILLSLYEMGHAIYPAAYISVGACIRYALALGINESLTVNFNSPGVMPLEQEEKRRAWWAVLILDRFVNIGYPKRPLMTQDPAPDAILPTDDTVFDQGAVTLDQLYTVSSPAEPGLSPFAKLAQAAYLLGCVFRHICDLRVDPMHQEEGMQLSGQVQRLLEVLSTESEMSATTAICSSALITLHDPNAANTHPAYLGFAKGLLQPVVEEPSQDVREFLAANIDYQAHPSPLLGHWIYQAGTVVLRLNAQTGEDFGKVEYVTQRLEALGQRWLSAGMWEDSGTQEWTNLLTVAYLHILTGS
ncbi:MAG: hypothetical protein LQ346_003012 [Caloplaca aetnensis]|nr:MAG: hypothetical protein LQ346_003012 [Caloplaca aetnensis]